MFDLPRIGTTAWGKLLQLNPTVIVYIIENKSLTAFENNQRLENCFSLSNTQQLFIQLWPDQIENKRLLIKNRLEVMNGQHQKIHARKCKVQEISAETMNLFLQQHHLQGKARAKVKYGLFFKNEIVAVALFAHPRAMTYNGRENHYSGELIRFCSKSGIRVVGGLDKLLKHYERQFTPNDVMTYVDKDWSNAASFIQLGFEKMGEISPIAFSLDKMKNRIKVVQPIDNTPYIWNSGSIKLVRNVHPKI